VDFHENLYLRQIVVHNKADREREVRLFLDWAADPALSSGVMAEQVHPYTNAPLSVSPLTWSHATLVMTVREYMARQAAISEHS
jgi:GH15 family glucan-1,4-alpha-glucosidase